MPHKDKVRRKEYMKIYYNKNRDILIESQEKYRKENRNKISQRHKIYYRENKQKIQEYNKNYIKSNDAKSKYISKLQTYITHFRIELQRVHPAFASDTRLF